jgi:AAHS family 4-hydroxybenzoate transporter-like MFS transporter
MNLDVTQIVDGQPVSRFLLGVLFLCTLVTLADGYNISVIAFAAPGIVKAWHLNRAALGPLFSSSLVAGLIGPFLFGTLADRIGRRSAMIGAVLTIGIFGVVSGYCTSVIPLIITRFIAGIGMSGALAVTVAAVNEFAPRRLRATFVTIVFSGTTIGSGLPGLVAPPLMAAHGWQSLFFLGGVVPVGLAMAVYLFLPETPKFLSLRASRHEDLSKLLRRLDPQLQVPADAHFVLSGEAAPAASSIGQLFTGKLVLLTPLLWFGSFVAMIVFHSFNTWLPTLMTDSGVPFAKASHMVVLFQFLGTLGGWIIARPLDRFGMLPCTILYVLSIPVVASLGFPGHSDLMMTVLVSMAGFCILGLHFAQVSCVSNVYPTSVRAFGVGWFMLFARVGGAIGPAVVGMLVGRHMSMNTLFYLATVPLALGTVASIAVTVLYQANYHRKADAAGSASSVTTSTPTSSSPA